MPDIEGNAKRFRDALLITVEYRNIKAKDDDLAACRQERQITV
jgi:hypothetical protein